MLILILFLVLSIRMAYPAPGGGGANPVPGAFSGVQTIIGSQYISVSPANGIGNVTVTYDGPTGSMGLTGATGPQGPTGTNGTNGVTGPTGSGGGGGVTSIIAGEGIDINPANGLGAVTIDAVLTTYVGSVLSTGQFSAGTGLILPGQNLFVVISITAPFIFDIGTHPLRFLHIDFKIPIYTATGTANFSFGLTPTISIPTTLTDCGIVSGAANTLTLPVHVMPCSEITSGSLYLYFENNSATDSLFVSAYAGKHLAIIN